MKYLLSFRFACVFGMVLLTVLPALRAQEYYFNWNGGAGNGLLGDGDNWTQGTAPTVDYSTLSFATENVTVFNDLPDIFLYLNITNGFSVTGSGLTVQNIRFDSTTPGQALIGTSVVINPSGFTPYINLFGYGSDPTPVAQNLIFTGGITIGSDVDVAGSGPDVSRVTLKGGSTVNGAGDGTGLRLNGITLALNNDVGNGSAAVADRFDGVALKVEVGGAVEMTGNSLADFTGTVEDIRVMGAGTLSVVNPGAYQTVFEAGVSLADSGLLLGKVSAGSKLLYTGQNDAAFLGRQYFYTDGGGINYASYSTVSGVGSATTSESLLSAGAADIVRQDTSVTLTGDKTVAALAFHGDTLDGAHTLTVTDMLVTQSAQISVDLDFGSGASSLTMENWDPNNYPLANFTGDIAGTGQWTVSGYGEANIHAATSFSGDLAVSGGYLNLLDAGSFTGVNAIYLKSEGNVPYSLIYLLGIDATGTPTVVDRLADDADIHVSGRGGISMDSLDSSIAVSERVGQTFLTGNASMNFSAYGDAETILTVTSVDLSAASNATLGLNAGSSSGEDVAVVLEGSTLLVTNGNDVFFGLYGGNSRVRTPGITVQSSPDTEIQFDVYNVGMVEGDFNLQDGSLYVDVHRDNDPQGVLNITGNFAMGETLQTTFASLGQPFESALVNVNGDLTLDGTLGFYLSSGYTEADRWLLFHYTGELVDNGWEFLYTQDADSFSISIDEVGKNVYLVAIPEPSTLALLGSGGLVAWLMARRRRAA